MSDVQSKRVLIIEDSKELVMSLITFLRPHGFVCTAAYDAVFGVSMAHKGEADLIILDLGLPAGGGFFVLENIKNSPATCTVPVIVLTAKPEKSFEDRAIKMGVAAYLHKPFEPEVLLEHIKKVLAT